MDFKFVHAADLHLDSPFRGISTASGRAAGFKEATLRALRRIVELCLAERVDFLLLAGDLFDTKDRSIRARLFLREQLDRLHVAGIQTFIVHGNHDPLSHEQGTGLRLPPSVKVFGATWEEVEVRRGETVVCRVQGISYPQERVSENLAVQFRRQGPEYTLGLLHSNVGGVKAHGNYAPCSLSDLAQADLDYWALGHVHTRADHALPNGGLAVYPGNSQGRHVLEDGERGCYLVEVIDRKPHLRFVSTDSIRWHRLEVDVSGIEGLELLTAELDERVDALRAEGLDGLAVRIELQGRGPLHRELRAPGALASLEEHLSEAWATRSPPVLLESIVDTSGSEVDLDEVLRGGGLAGAVLQLRHAPQAFIDELWQEDDELRRLDAALRRAGLAPTQDEARSLLNHATGRAIELLSEESA